MKRRASNLESLLLENILFSHYITDICFVQKLKQYREEKGREGWREERREKMGKEGREEGRE